MRLTVTAFVALLVACGGQDSGTATPAGEAPQSASATGQESAGTPSMPEAAEMPATPPEVASCLSLVKQAEFQQAIQVCLAALDASPGNSEVEAALAKARDETAKQAAADAATGAAQDAAGGAAGSMPDMPTGLDR